MTEQTVDENVQIDDFNDDDDEAEEEKHDDLQLDQVPNDFDVDEGVAVEDRTNGAWTFSDFMNEDRIPEFTLDWGANKRRMEELGCEHVLFRSVVILMTTYIMNTFVTATDNFGSRMFGQKWKPFSVNECKSFISIILVLDQIKRNVKQDPFWYVSSYVDSLRKKI